MIVPDIRHFFFSIQTNLLYLYIIHIDSIQPYCRFQPNIQQTACCFEPHFLVGIWLILTINVKNLNRSLSSFQTAKLANLQHRFSCVKYATSVFMS